MKTKVIILGGGITGLLTAYFLNKNGLDVTIIEKRTGVGLGASLANGSQISFSHIVPTIFEKKSNIFGNLFLKASVESKINKNATGVKEFLAKQRSEMQKEDENILNLSKIAEISSYCLSQIISEESLERRFKSCGILHYFSNTANLKRFSEKAKKINQKFRIVNSYEALEIEPNLANFSTKIIGGVYFEDDKTSNCHDLCKIFETLLKERGVEIILNTTITELKSSNSKIIAAISDKKEQFKADLFVCANGTEVGKITKTVGLEFDIFPVRGYSCTFNVENSNYVPFIGLIDKENRMVYSLYKTYLRVAGFFDLGVNEPEEIAERMKEFESAIFASFPLLKRNKIVHKWTENRPFTPSSVPIIGKTLEFSNLLINAGHSSLGLTLSFGAGKIISELI